MTFPTLTTKSNNMVLLQFWYYLLIFFRLAKARTAKTNLVQVSELKTVKNVITLPPKPERDDLKNEEVLENIVFDRNSNSKLSEPSNNYVKSKNDSANNSNDSPMKLSDTNQSLIQPNLNTTDDCETL